MELPRDVLDAFSEEFPLVYDGHEGALDYSSLENHMPPYHGWKSRNDVRKEEAGKFFQYVNKAVTDYLVAGTDLPVILVSLPEHQSAFRRISTIPICWTRASRRTSAASRPPSSCPMRKPSSSMCARRVRPSCWRSSAMPRRTAARHRT